MRNQVPDLRRARDLDAHVQPDTGPRGEPIQQPSQPAVRGQADERNRGERVEGQRPAPAAGWPGGVARTSSSSNSGTASTRSGTPCPTGAITTLRTGRTADCSTRSQATWTSTGTDTPAGRLREHMSDQDGRQPGDPVRAAEAIVASPGTPTRRGGCRSAGPP